MILYDLLLGVSLLFLQPLRKKLPTLKDRLSLTPPDPRGRSVLWIHAVSVGEVKAALPLLKQLRLKHPDAFILITTTTATGQQEAKRTLLEADAYRFLPFDFSWVMKRWTKALQPRLLLFVETDFWYHLLHYAKKEGARIALVSGKLSERSAKRFSLFKPLAKKLFRPFDLVIVQNEEHRKRFAPFVSAPLHIGGNLKLDSAPEPVDLTSLRSRFEGSWITVSSTHHPEEELLLPILKPLLTRYRLFLAPRHPERCAAVAALLQRLNIPFNRIDDPAITERVVLVDKLGRLAACYSLSRAALVAGSFIPHIGGHNVLEPLLYNCPSFFGPYTHAQRELVRLVESFRGGRALNLSEIESQLETLTPEYTENIPSLLRSIHGSSAKTLSLLY